MARERKIGFAVRIKDNGEYPRYEITFKNGKPHRCRRTAESREIPIPTDASFYAIHPKDAKGNRATAMGSPLEAAFARYQQFEAAYQRKEKGLMLIDDFVEHAPQSTGERITIADAAERYLLKVKTSKSKATYTAYRGGLKDFKSSCKKVFTDELTKEDLIGYLGWMQDNLRKNSIGDPNVTYKKRLGFVNTFLADYGKKDLWSAKQWPKAVKKRPDRYTAEEITAVLKAATQKESLLIRFFLYSGCRDMEIASAEFSNLNTKKGVFEIRAKSRALPGMDYAWKPKTSEERDQVLPKDFIKELMVWKEKTKLKGNDLIFPNRAEHVDHNLIEFLQRAAKRVGITGRVTLHKIRRSAISHQIDKFGVRKAMAFAGHSSIATTNKYAAKDDMTAPEIRKEVEASMAELVGE